MKPTIQLLISFGIALVFVIGMHKIVVGQLIPEPSARGIFSMELAVFVLLLTSYIVTEIQTLLGPRTNHLRFRNIFFLLVAFFGSGAIYAALTKIIG